MQSDKLLRQHVVKLLTSQDAHVDFETAIKDLPAKVRGQRPKGAEHSPWEVLEHLRITQWDLLEFAINPQHKSPEFPAGYWPASQAPAGDAEWDRSAENFRKDLKRLCELVSTESMDLFAKIPHGDGQTVLRQALVTADHNGYHLGELVLLRRMLGAWRSS